MNDGDSHGWHYDEAQFTVSVMLQAPDGGGRYEYVSGLRGEDFDDYDGLSRVLDGDRSRVEAVPITPGTLMLFGGRHLLHRVSPVEGQTTRYIATLCYRDRPGMANSPEVRALFYGRTEPLKRVV
ncbi:MAG: 2OG-Fe(II) oxygenase [Rhodospirillales bacterium]|nr:2OG-Fe(II) oxygenase [Rhodospirillales bacterium]